jgi:hypothetical protein
MSSRILSLARSFLERLLVILSCSSINSRSEGRLSLLPVSYLCKSVVVVGLFLGYVLTCGPPSLNFLKYSSNLVKLVDPS